MTRRYLDAAAFGTGLAVMATEIGAGRLVAPALGTSTPVWATVIGAVLASLAVGQVVGGRLAARGHGTRTLALVLVGAGILVAALPPVANGVLGSGLGLLGSSRLLTLAAGAVAVTLLLALPVAALGAVGPILLREAAGGADLGRVTGRIYALGTAGSLAGTYATGLVLIPLVGTTRALALAAAVLVALGVGGLVGRWAAALAFVLLPLLVPLPSASRPGVVFEADSAHNHVRVTEDGRTRALSLNEGYAVQSLLPLDGSLPLHDVWGWYAKAPAWTTGGRPENVLLVGLGGGTSARTLQALYPEASVTGVEPDPLVVQVAREWMDLPDSVEVVVDDGRAFLNRDRRRWDLVVVDAFAFPYVPFQLTTRQFMAALDRALAPGGAVLLNVGRWGRHDAVVDAVAATAASVFPHVRGAAANARSNTMLVLTRHGPAEDAGVDRLGLSPARAAALRGLAEPQPWPVDGAPVLTDDHAPVELLTDRVMLAALLDLAAPSVLAARP